LYAIEKQNGFLYILNIILIQGVILMLEYNNNATNYNYFGT